MPKQSGFSDLEYAQKKRLTRREKFLHEMELAVPWSELVALIAPHYPKAGKQGRQPKGADSIGAKSVPVGSAERLIQDVLLLPN